MTANLVPRDWTALENASIDAALSLRMYPLNGLFQTVWLQDFPVRGPTPYWKDSDFAFQFTSILEQLGFQPALDALVDNIEPLPSTSAPHHKALRGSPGDVIFKNFPDIPLQSLYDLCWKWDFSNIGQVKLVSSAPGWHFGWRAIRETGHPRLMTCVRQLSCQVLDGVGLSIECQVEPYFA